MVWSCFWHKMGTIKTWGYLEMEQQKHTLTQTEYDDLVKSYQQALQIICVKLESLNEEYRAREFDYPVHNIQKRIKQKKSIEQKLLRQNKPVSVEDAKDSLMDIAGVRVICYFKKDIYEIADQIKRQTELIVLKERDYIREPKANGYKSYHIVVGVPVCTVEGTEYYPVEIQLRTLGMDFWSSMEHRVCYKPCEDYRKNENAAQVFEEIADYVEQLEEVMEQCV